VALWLAAQATPQTEALLREETVRRLVYSYADEESGETIRSVEPFLQFGGGVYYMATGDVVSWTRPEADLAVRLLDLPEDEVAETLRVHWDRVVDPATSSEEVASLFGLAAPNLGAMVEQEGVDAATARRLVADFRRDSVPCR
jgi:hypothetical protein